MAQNPVRWFEIYVQDMNRARKFYENVFDVSLERLNTPDVEIWSFSMQIEVIERDPYPGVEYESRRAYVFAIKPGMLKSPQPIRLRQNCKVVSIHSSAFTLATKGERQWPSLSR